MTPAVRRAAEPVLGSLDARVRRSVLRRVEDMERELKFLGDREDEKLVLIRQRGWTDERMQLLFVLNSVYQIVIGPLQSAGRMGPEGLGRAVPVKHGTLLVNAESAQGAQKAMRAFGAMVRALKYWQELLYCSTCGDAVFSIAVMLKDGDWGNVANE